MYMGAFYLVFTHIRQRGDENYVMFLLSGLIAWKWFHTTITGGANSLMANAGLMNQVYLPKIIFPLTTVTVNTIKFMLVMILFLLFLQIFSSGASISWIFLPVIIAVQLLLIVALTCIFSALTPFFPDFKLIIQNVMLILLFLSGIFYDISSLPKKVEKALLFNPMASLIPMYRDVLLNNIGPDWIRLFYITIVSVLIFCFAFYLFVRFDRLYPKIVR
jgi:lipopolysaccharide transport system permease protein